jgi:hypothetical protein
MLKRHALGSLLVLVGVLLACKKGEQISVGDDASAPTTVTTTATTASASPTAATSTFKVGDTIDVQWNGSWYESQILAVEAGPKYKIHYVGWSDSYDESVEPARVRARSGSASASASVATPPASVRAAPTSTVTIIPGNKIGEEMPTRGKCLAGWVVAEEACHRPCSQDTDCAPPTSFCKKWQGKKLCARTGSLVVPMD